MNADYCVNLEVGEINSSGGWSDMADLAGHHSFPDGMTEYGYDGYTTGFYKAYLRDDNWSQSVWVTSFRLYFTSLDVCPVWTHCDTGK